LKDLNSYVSVEEIKIDKLEAFLNADIYVDFDLVIVTEFFPLDFVI